ncbi:MAG: 50S ribosomal protein L2 [Flavobacteriales bacterium]|nr:50S ribosomal protein L2 [Flavobacteriales bacterium]MBL4734857.1 50S ribosomal protein L2 [Flavobacteriales bacterium]
MAVRKLKPVTPGQRFKVISAFDSITASKPEKSLVAGKHRSGGRNDTGKMTVRNVGGGHKKRYRVIDFKRDNDGVPGKVKSIEYDPNRTARIALVYYANGDKRYIIAPNGIKVDQVVEAGEKAQPEVGNALYLKDVPFGTIIHNIELRPGQGGVLARGAGGYAQLTAKEGKYVNVKLPSGETRMILATCKATIGVVSNGDHQLLTIGKAGGNRWRGKRPRTRGVAMNPVDHPMGGGEGKASGGHPRSRTGLPAKGYKTRAKKKSSNKYIVEKRKK